MAKKFMLPFLNLLLASAAIALYVMTFLNRALMKTLFSRAGHYLILLLVLAWVATLIECIRIYRPDFRSFIKSYGSGLVICLLLASVVFISVRPSFRVLSDETNLTAISKSMIYEKRTDNVTMGKWYYDNFYPTNREVPKRPLLFPFLAYIIHALLGYRPENLFILNFLLLFSLLFLIYALIKNHLGSTWAFSAVILVAAQPVVSQAATSAGFDLLAAVFLVICFMCLAWFLKESSAIRFQLLWVSLLMLVNIRHEGIMVFAIVIASLTCSRCIKIDFFRKGISVIYFSTPLVLLLTFWQRFLTKRPFETEGVAFSLGYFIKNNIIFLKSLFNYEFFLPYATIINFVGFLALIYFGYLFLSKRILIERHKRHLAFVSAAALFANWVLYTSYYNGHMDHPSNSRYYVIFFVLLSVFAVILANRFRFFKQGPAYFLGLSVLMFALYHPVSVEDRFSRTQTLPRRYRFAMDFLKKEGKKNRNFLVISNRPGQYTVHDYGAVNFECANKDHSVIEGYKSHLFENIFVIQDIEYATLEPTENTRLDKKFRLEKITELQNKRVYFTRISRVTAVAGESRAD